MIALGLAAWRLSPDAFWRLTPREIALALDGLGAPAPLARADLDALISRYPDG